MASDEINQAAKLIAEECDQLKKMLLEKNQNYGNSALDPLRIFATSDRVEQIKVRIDDKLSRLKRGSAAGEDVVNDLLGYLILLRVAQRIQPVVKDLCSEHGCSRDRCNGQYHARPVDSSAQ